jgi:hypothetical protein
VKTIIAVLSESPLYFTMALQERHGLVKRLAAKKQEIDLSRYQAIVDEFIKAPETNLSKFPRFCVSFTPGLDEF